MEMFQPHLDEVNIGVRHAARVLEVQKMRPGLHVVMKAGLATLARHGGLEYGNGYPRVAGDVGEEPYNLVAAELGDEVTS